MGRHARSRGEQTRRDAHLLLGAMGVLVLLTIAAVSYSTLASRSGHGRKEVTDALPASAASATTVASAQPSETTTAATSVTRPSKPAASETSVKKTLPEEMKRLLPGSRQLLVITGEKLGSNTGRLRIFNEENGHWVQVFSAPSRFGTNGLTDGATRHSGNRTTPTGIWWIGSFVFGHHQDPPSGTLMPYRQTTQNSWWSWQRDSTYNTWVESSKRIGGEHLASVTPQYEFALSTGYNAPPNERVIGRGTAIFLHVFDPPDYNHGFSAGCVAVSRANMIRVLRIVDPRRKPSFVIGTLEKGTKTSAYAY